MGRVKQQSDASIDPSTVFFNFFMTEEKSVDTPARKALKLAKLSSLKVMRRKRMKIQLRKVVKIYRRLHGGGREGKFVPATI